MACSKIVFMIALVTISGLVHSASAKVYIVGDEIGWTLGQPATFYDDWAEPFTFVVGDILVFNYASTSHNVLQVSLADLGSCSINKPLAVHATSGGATVALTSKGFHGFICGVGTHCVNNMRFGIEVVGSLLNTTSADSPPRSSTPPTPAPGSTGAASVLRSPAPIVLIGALLGTFSLALML